MTAGAGRGASSAVDGAKPKHTSASSLRRSAEHGFTLIELMVVIAIIGIASASVLLAFPDPRGSLRGEAERFAARVRAAQDDAVMQARPIALVAQAGGYRFEQRRAGRWLQIDAQPMEPARWGKGTRAQIAGEGGRAVFDPTGIGDPLDLTLIRDGAKVTVHVRTGGSVDVAG